MIPSRHPGAITLRLAPTSHLSTILFAALLAVLWCLTQPVSAQWNPQQGEWNKSDPDHLRVMTWNVRDRLCSTNSKQDNGGTWHGMSVVVAAARPDVLILQETGDNSGNGTGSSADSTATLTSVVNLFIDGGADPFQGGTVTAFVKKYAPGYDLPHRFVSTNSDGFNRNIILSRYPFADLNGDGKATLSDMPNVNGESYSAGGTGGIRGFMFAEIDLPNDTYEGDLVVGNAHLKSGGDSSSQAQRLTASQNVAYYIHALLAGAGTGVPDANNAFFDNPPATSILSGSTAVVIGGDWNEDENTNGRRGPALWLTQGEFAAGTDGTDRDTTDAEFDTAVDLFSGSRVTQNSGSKLDYIAWWDSVATPVHQFVFNSATMPAQARPPEFSNHPFPQSVSSASDHRPVIVDLELPTIPQGPPGSFNLIAPLDGQGSIPLEPTLSWSASDFADDYTVTIAVDAALTNVVATIGPLGSTSTTLTASTLDFATTYHWGVTATNALASAGSTPFSRSFTTVAPPSPGQFFLFLPIDGTTSFPFDGTLDWGNSAGASTYRVTLARDTTFSDVFRVVDGLTASTLTLGSGTPVLQPCERVFWRVEALNAGGATVSLPTFRGFTVENPLDIADDFGTLGGDGIVSFGDFLALLGLIGPCPGGTPSCTGDIADDFGTLGPDGQVSFGDFLALLGFVGFTCL